MHAFERVSSFGPGGKKKDPLFRIVRSSSLTTSFLNSQALTDYSFVGLDSTYAEPFEESKEGLMDHAVKD